MKDVVSSKGVLDIREAEVCCCVDVSDLRLCLQHPTSPYYSASRPSSHCSARVWQVSPAKRRRKVVDYAALNAEMFGDFECYKGEMSDDDWH